MAEPVSRLAIAIWWRARRMMATATARLRSVSRLRDGPIRRVLVVCHGNIYRSAFVGRYLLQHLPEGVSVRSGGFHPAAGRPAPERHILYSRRYGVDLAEHRSAVINSSDIEWADTIVLMDSRNWQALTNLGAPSDRLIWLGVLDGDGVEIPDPDRLSDDEAAAVVDRLHECARMLVTRISVPRASRP
jgi:protein-tyrosine phosphatase